MLSIWLYRFKPGMTADTLEKLRARGVEKLYPGCTAKGGTFLGRCWGHPRFTYGSLFKRETLADMAREAQDIENLLENLRILSPAVAAMEVRNLIPGNDPELLSLGDDAWHAKSVEPWVKAAKSTPEVAEHLNVIGMSCLGQDLIPPYMINAFWRDKFGYPQQWVGGENPRPAAKESASAA